MERPTKEERANTATHAFGVVLGLIGATLLLSRTFQQSNLTIQLNCVIYAISLVGVYVSSTLSHYYADAERKKLYRILDQTFIYLLIASTFSALSVRFLHGFWWSFLLAAMWTVAVVGAVSKLFFAHRVQTVSIWAYLLLGWMPILGALGYGGVVPIGCLACVLAGGFAYSAGTVFLFRDRQVWYFHSVWHLFVMVGSTFHFVAIYQHIF